MGNSQEELIKQLLQVVKEYRDHHFNGPMCCVEGESGRCPICIKADLLLPPKPADTGEEK